MSSKTSSAQALTWPWSSITGRLTLLYTLSASAILILCAAILYWILAANLDTLTNEFVAAEMHDIVTVLGPWPNDQKVLLAEINYEGVEQYPQYYARILDGKGNTLIETRQMSEFVSVSEFPEPSSEGQRPDKTKKWRSTEGKEYQLAAVAVNFGPSMNDPRVVQLAFDISQEQSILADFRRKLAGVMVLGICISAAAGIAAARLGMRPLHSITQAAQRISPAQLHGRISPQPWPQELMALAAAFDGMLDRLEDSFNRLSQFSADLAHELRTPINNMMGEAEVVLTRQRSSQEYREVLESSLEELGRLSRVIDSLLFIARAESPETRIQAADLDVRKELESVVEFHNAVAQEQGVEITCNGDGTIHADPVLFRQAVSNVLTNALRYTHGAGKIDVSVDHSDPQWVSVSVSDTGVGIDAEHLPKIFDRFYRVDPSRSRHPQGMGLGLAIVKSIMSLHGGTAAIASTRGKGTVVILTFPFTRTTSAI